MTTIFKLKNHSHISIAKRLRALSRNMWWTWNPEAQALFNELSPLIWRYSNHNAVEVMQDISEWELEARLRDHEFSRRAHNVLEEFDLYMAEPSTWSRHHAPTLKNPVAYFSAEFGIHESLPIYSGGLGILSGESYEICKRPWHTFHWYRIILSPRIFPATNKYRGMSGRIISSK